MKTLDTTVPYDCKDQDINSKELVYADVELYNDRNESFTYTLMGDDLRNLLETIKGYYTIG